MTTSPSDPLPMPEPEPTPPAGRRVALPVIGGVVAGVLVGVGAGFLLFGGGGAAAVGDDDEPARAQALADTGCAMIERIDREYASEDDFDGGLDQNSVFWEAPAAGYLLISAALLDPQYADLEEPGQTTIAALSRMRLEDLSADAAAACAAR